MAPFLESKRKFRLERFTDDLRHKPIVFGMLLVFATIALYWRVIHYQFQVFDDQAYVTQNVHVSAGLKFAGVVWSFTAFHEGNWHPITWLSHMADCQWFGLHPGPHHMVNVFLHAANVLLLFLLLQRATGAVWRSFFLAAFFALHPLNVETVAWVAERKSLLSMFFSLLAIAAYGWYVKGPDWKKYLLIVLAFSLALMSKPMAVSVPLVLLLLDFWPLARNADLPFRRRWTILAIEKLPLLLMSAASSIVTIVAQRSGGAIADITTLPFSVRIENAVVSYVAYVGKAVWPSNLSVFYPLPEKPWPWPVVLAAAVIVLAITSASLYFRRFGYLAVGWCLFLITLLPVIGIMQVGSQVMADRYAYVPSIGLFLIIAWGLYDVASAAAVPRLVTALAALAAIIALAVATCRYLPYWQNGVALFTRAAVVSNRLNFTIEEALADALLPEGRDTEAYQHYSAACTMRPGYPLCHYNIARILFNHHQFRDALEQVQIAESLARDKDLALSCLINEGAVLLVLGDYRTAQMRLATALQMDPKNGDALRLLQRVPNQSSVRGNE